MLEEGLSYPLRGERAFGRILIGGLLGVFSVFILPGIILFGYLIRVLAFSARDIEEPPAFTEWGRLLADGLKGIFVTIAYGIVPFIILVVAIAFTGAGVASTDPSTGGALAALGIIGLLLSFLAFVLLYYLIPAALTNLALEGRMSAAFDVGTLKRPLLGLEYFLAWLLPFLIALLVNIISVLVVVFTLGLGVLVLPFIQFYFQVSVFYMFGRAFGSVVEPEEGRGTAGDERRARAG